MEGLDDGFGHRVNTVTGSMRVTCRIAAISDTTHMASVSRNNIRENVGVMTTVNAVSAVAATTIKPMPAARPNPMTPRIRALQVMTWWEETPDAPIAVAFSKSST